MDTIYALSSGGLPSGVAVVRVSGPAALDALARLAGTCPPPRTARLRTLRHDGHVIDRALVLAFRAPASATGEDVAEFHVHGGRAVVAALLAALADHGLRPANPGEFTRRAFDNGRLDLTQAEGLADLIAAETEGQRRAALAQSGGHLRARVEAWREALIDLLAETEAELDFAEAEDDVATRVSGTAVREYTRLADEMADALSAAARSRPLREGLTIVVAGPPNVGKSSLVNALAQREVAIVSSLPGTTRDAIEVRLDLGGVLVTLVDTAGLRDTADPLEAEGIARARWRAAEADLVLNLYCEGARPETGLAVRTKADLAPGDGHDLTVSSLTGLGIDELSTQLSTWAAEIARPDEPPLIGQERQRLAVSVAYSALIEASETADGVLKAESLRAAAASLGALIGKVSVEDVLDRVFSRFCIGK